VIFVSDNGAPFLNSKTTLYDAGVRLPLIVRSPGAASGIVNSVMVSFIEVLPTCLDWASKSPLEDKAVSPLLGKSFLKILEAIHSLPSEQCQQFVFGSHTFHEV
jgi:N-sulfoglucosamine sulfohydrolase